MKRRKVELVVLSDTHLGTYGCHARELADYLGSIKPETLVLNGDIIDMWQFSKRYWPKSQNAVIKQVFKLLEKGSTVYYITGNHDDNLRKHSGLLLGDLHLVDELELNLGGKKHLFFHGDLFDVIVQNNRWLSKIGGYSYDLLILLNRIINRSLEKLGKDKMSFSKKIKSSVKGAIKFINDFEQTSIYYAIDRGYDAVICGHIHQPVIKSVVSKKKPITYLNRGDWVENCTALEFNKGQWNLFEYFKQARKTKVTKALR